ncbi:MAG: neutral/alkaline non-lysosomal ceramidase N-terminal domain-containing protein [Bryobacteraceae bacterium]
MNRILLLFVLAAAPASSAWKAGVAAENITPNEPIWLAGYASRDRPASEVRQEIFAKALALEDETGAVSVIVTLDLVGIRRDLAEEIASHAATAHGIPRERILFNASHTHSAPLVGSNSSYEHRMGSYLEKQKGAVARYTDSLRDKISGVVGRAVGSRETVTLGFEQGYAGFAVNRRRVGHREYPGPVDHDVPVLALKSPDGRLKAILFGYACHNTILADYTIHGDYAGYAQQFLEERHPGAVALFVQGAGADSNPLPRRKPEHLQRYGATLADGVDEVLAKNMKPVTGPLRAAIEFAEVRFAPHTREEFEQRAKSGNETERRHAAKQLEQYANNGKFIETHPYPVQAWRFGQAFTMMALAGELVVDYALRIKGKYGWDNTWVAGYSNDVFGYIPSLRVLKEGGYEGGDAYYFGSFPGHLAPDIEDRIWAAVERVAAQVGSQGAAR